MAEQREDYHEFEGEECDDLTGGRSKYYCLPFCKSAFYTRDGIPTGIRFFKFPDDHRKLRWLNLIKRKENKKPDVFRVSKHTKICQKHFKTTDISRSYNTGKHTLKKGAEPSGFECWPESFRKKVKEERKAPADRFAASISGNYLMDVENEITVSQDEDMATEEKSDVGSETEYDCPSCKDLRQQLHDIRLENIKLKSENEELLSKVSELNETVKEYEESQFSYENISKDPALFKSFTGLPHDRFVMLYHICNPGSKSENIRYYDAAKVKAQKEVENMHLQDHDYCNKTKRKAGPRPKENPKEQLFMTLFWLRCSPTLIFLTFIKKLPLTTVSRYLITWVNYLYFVLGSIPIWATKEQIKLSMPQCSKDTYPDTRCIIDCTELFTQVPSSLAIQSALYSTYKHHVTCNGLIGIAPSGAVIFVSQLYPGSLSDKEIVCRSGFLNPIFIG